MEIKANIGSLQDLKFLQLRNTYWVEYEQLTLFLKHKKEENEVPIQNHNLLRDLRSYKPGIDYYNDKRIVCVPAVLRYVMKLADKYAICNTIVNDLTKLLFANTNNEGPLAYIDLYTKIANSELWCEDQLKDVEIKDSATLYSDYKDRFTRTQWKKICYFEYHFEKECAKTLNYEHEIHEKYAMLDRLLDIQNVARKSKRKCDNTMSTNISRKAAASDAIHGQKCFHNGSNHSYVVLDRTLNQCLVEYANVSGQCVTVSCNGSCTHQGDVHVVVEFTNPASESLKDIADLLSAELYKKHAIRSTQYVFVKDGTLENYKCKFCEDGETHRFQLQCDMHKSQDFVVGAASTQLQECDVSEILPRCPELKLCVECYGSILPYVADTLDWRSLDIISEWIHHVPLEVQVFFSSWFLNKEHFRRSRDPDMFLRSKLTRMYALFDAGLTISNRKYHGVIQRLNSEELLVNYHSLSTIFDITSSFGCTKSLTTAERWLKRLSDPNVSHYQTYISKYPLYYQSLGETEASTHDVSLKDCHLVFFMDNLVRVSTHEDPDPGQSRSSSVCTLPITIKGLPRDSIMTESWHSNECTDMSGDCMCMEAVSLTRVDYNLLIDCTTAESKAWQTFQNQLKWGLLKQCIQDGVLSDFLTITNQEELVSQWNAEENLSESDKETNELAMNTLESEFEESLNLNMSVSEDSFIEGLHYLQEHDDVHSSFTESKYRHIEQRNQDSATEVPNGFSEGFFKEFEVPPLLCRHPIPATGRDDCKINIKKVLDENLQMLDRHAGQKDRILFAPDHKISHHVLKLMKDDKKYEQFLMEFPALHLRKSKINNLFSAYEKAGLSHMLQFMKDSEQESDWRKLITLQNIETATRNVIRLSFALHLAMFSKFHASLSEEQRRLFDADLHMMSAVKLSQKWDQTFGKFCTTGCSRNANFELHHDIMNHCDEIVAISFAERIGGPNGYHLMLASVKKSLPFAFLNGSSSYAAFCVDLLHEHYRAGPFHKNMKMSLFATPHKDSKANIALDTQREMDHKDAIKAFRPRSTLETVVPRMTVVDHFIDINRIRLDLLKPSRDATIDDSTDTSQSLNISETTSMNRHIQIKVSSKDWKHSLPLVKMLERQHAFSLDSILVPQNLYTTNGLTNFLECEVLDSNSYSVGQFLIRKYAASNKLFGLDLHDIPDKQNVDGPTILVRKAFGKSTTLRRVASNNKPCTSKSLSSADRAERKRQANVRKQTKMYDCLSSEMNTCQALLNPDGSKPTVQKANGIKKALITAIQKLNPANANMNEHSFIKEGFDTVPAQLRRTITHATIEFAGIKFRSKAASGQEYIRHIENGIIKKTLETFPHVTSIVVCEEKYSFTPDDFKCATRLKRKQNVESTSIAHLKSGDEILSERKMSRSAVISTTEGRRMISNYLARNLHNLDIKTNMQLITDSELLIECPEKCEDIETCHHGLYAIPIKSYYNDTGYVYQEPLTIRQRKGEAEMAQIDWLSTIQPQLNQTEAVISIISSGDIDSVLIHMFALSLHWPRVEDGSFKNPVYILLQKVKSDFYNITDLILFFERALGFKLAGLDLAIVCMMGGNDFIPGYFEKTHEKWISVFLRDRELLQSLLKIEKRDGYGMPTDIKLEENSYMKALKILYSGKMAEPDNLTFDEVRQISVKLPGREAKVPTQWMPPYSAVKSMVQLMNLQIEYMMTAWHHDAPLPDFLGEGCLIKDCETGCISYSFGKNVKVANVSDLIQIDEDILGKKMKSRQVKPKRNNDSRTPQKEEAPAKRRAQRDTPKKMRKPGCSKSLQLNANPTED